MVTTPHSEINSGTREGVRGFWEQSACGQVYARGASLLEALEAQARTRYELEPYIYEFAHFAEASGRDVLEVGVGMGADHLEWARARPRSLTGIDLTSRAIDYTRSRLSLYGLMSRLMVGDAERLPFDSDSFDIVYSWGVLHHTPDTPRSVREVWRVLRRGGVARVMVYHTYSLVGYMLWARYGLMNGQPHRSLSDIYAHHLESPGTKAYSADQARELFSDFRQVNVRVRLSGGDLLQGAVGQRHRGRLLTLAKRMWPRWLVARLFARYGLFMLIEAVK